jgi:uncharacterized coiled-coil DUF342 family protein
MLEEVETKNLLARLREVETAVLDLKRKLSLVNKRRSDLFSKKDAAITAIKARIGELSESKVMRNKLTNEVKEKKKIRDELNQLINIEVSLIKTLKSEYEAVKAKTGLKEDPRDLGRQIEKLEYKIQTEPMSFEKEQKLNKTIKDLKKKLNESKAVLEKSRELHAKSKLIDELKRKANSVHKELQEEAAKSQAHHEEIIEKYKSIDEARKGGDGLSDVAEELRREQAELSQALKEKLDNLKELRKLLQDNKVEFDQKSKERVRLGLDEKRREVEEKMRSGKTLTTEDLLIMQGGLK